MKYLFVLLSTFSLNVFAGDLATEKSLGEAYVAAMKKEANAIVIEDNIVVRPVFVSGATASPQPTDIIEVMYEGFDREGKVFDSSFLRDQTATFPLNGVIQCWQKAMVKATVGSVYKITCPSDQAYGDTGASGFIKPGAAISFRVVLLKIK